VTERLQLATRVAKSLRMVPTWPNLRTIEIALSSEAEVSGVSLKEAAELIIECGRHQTSAPAYRCPAEWEARQAFRENTIDRFWFEDARWRVKFPYAEFRARLGEEVA